MSVYDIAYQMIEEGLSVIPVNPETKQPMVKWDQYKENIASVETVERWEKLFPNAGIAMVCGTVSNNLYAIDADNALGKQWLEDNAPPPVVKQRTPSGGEHAIYKMPDKDVISRKIRIFGNGKDDPHIDIMGEKGYIVVWPTTNYEWAYTEAFTDWSDIPVWDYRVKDVSNVIPIDGNVNIDLTKAKPLTREYDKITKGDRNNTLAQKTGRWVALGLTMEEVTGLAFWWNDMFSQPKLLNYEIMNTVNSIYNIHYQNNPLSNIASIDRISKKIFPVHLLQPGGILQDIMEYIEKSSAASHPIFNLPAAITILGTVAGQRIMTETGLRTNFYCICSGYSGSGKNAPHKTITTLLGKGDTLDLIGPNHPTSEAAILHWISKKGQESTILRIDEIGHLLKKARNPRSPAHQIPNLLTEIFTSTNNCILKGYAGPDELRISWSHVCIYGSSTPKVFWESLTSDGVSNGFLPRILVFDSRHIPKKPKKDIDLVYPEDLADELDQIYKINIEYEPPQKDLDSPIPIPHRIYKDSDALKYFDEWENGQQDLKIKYCESNEMLAAVYNRTAEHAHKLALIHCLSKHGAEIVNEKVEIDSVKWATELVDVLIDDVKIRIEEELADGEWERLQNKVMTIIRSKYTPKRRGASASEILRHMHKPRKLVEELLNTMIASELIAKDVYKGQRGPGTTIYGVSTFKKFKE